jgi:hypothetical protein
MLINKSDALFNLYRLLPEQGLEVCALIKKGMTNLMTMKILLKKSNEPLL